jgi:hypothetical protein
LRLIALALSVLAVAPATASVSPAVDGVFTSTRYVTAIALAPDGTVWAGTMGGVLSRGPDGRWRKFTRADGLPSHEVLGLVVEDDTVVVVFPQASASWRDGRWQVGPRDSSTSRPPRRSGEEHDV